MVVRTLLDQQEATSRTALLRVFKGSLQEPLQRLTTRSVLKRGSPTSGVETYLPTIIAIYLCGDADVLSQARKSTEITLQVVRSLFERQLETNRMEPFTREDALTEALLIDGSIQPPMIWLGLYLAEEFSIFQMLQKDEKQIGITFFRPGAMKRYCGKYPKL